MEKKNRLKWITTLRKIRINRSMTKYTLALFFPFRKQKKKQNIFFQMSSRITSTFNKTESSNQETKIGRQSKMEEE